LYDQENVGLGCGIVLTPEQFSLLRHAVIILGAWLAFLLLAYWAPRPGGDGHAALGLGAAGATQAISQRD